MRKMLLGVLYALIAFGARTAVAAEGPGWVPPAGSVQVPPWPNGAADAPQARPAPESVSTVRTKTGHDYLAIANVSAPTITVLPPKGANSGAAILVFPGGGFSILAMDIEGTDICDWVTARGMTDQAPPTFRLQAWDDPVDRIGNSTVYVRALDAAGVRAEVHLFAKGGHAFGVRPTGHPVSSWPALVENWLDEIEVF